MRGNASDYNEAPTSEDPDQQDKALTFGRATTARMSTGPIMDHFWVFVAGVVTAPLFGAYGTALLVRRRASRRGFAIEARQWSLVGVVAALFVLMPLGGGFVLKLLRGIPPGLGFAKTFLFLFGVYAGPVALGAFLFGRYLSPRLSARDEGDGSESRPSLSTMDRKARKALTEIRLWFVGGHLALFPAIWVLAILAS